MIRFSSSMRHLAPMVALCISGFALAGCSSDSKGTTAWTSLDTAFVIISTPTDTALFMPESVSLFRGGVVVQDNFGGRLIAFNADGTPRWAYERRGEGPGELGYVADTAESPEGLWAVDIRNRRLILISDAGSFIRELPLPPEVRGVTEIRISGGSAILLTSYGLSRVKLSDGALEGQDAIPWQSPPPPNWVSITTMTTLDDRTALGMKYGPETLIVRGGTVQTGIKNSVVQYRVSGDPTAAGGGAYAASAPMVGRFGAMSLAFVGAELWALTGGSSGGGAPDLPSNQIVVFAADGAMLGAHEVPVNGIDFAVSSEAIYLLQQEPATLLALKR